MWVTLHSLYSAKLMASQPQEPHSTALLFRYEIPVWTWFRKPPNPKMVEFKFFHLFRNIKKMWIWPWKLQNAISFRILNCLDGHIIGMLSSKQHVVYFHGHQRLQHPHITLTYEIKRAKFLSNFDLKLRSMSWLICVF